MFSQKRGFALIEILVAVVIIGILVSIVLVSFFDVREKARDTKRKAELFQFGRILTFSCYLPDGGEGTYDFKQLAQELLNKYPNHREVLSNMPKDPKTGTESESKYFYIVNTDGTQCAVFANLENPNEPVTLSITTPAPGGGNGVFRADSPGWNGTPLFVQYSN